MKGLVRWWTPALGEGDRGRCARERTRALHNERESLTGSRSRGAAVDYDDEQIR